ncbi:MAG: hydroxypyruvate isomerase family protein [Mycobacteriales bacterium]
MRVAGNLAFLFPDLPWPDRPAAARAAGLAAVEFPWPPDPDALAAAVGRAGVAVVLCNVDAGDLAAGDRGYAHDPARRPAWRQALDRALRFAERTGCPTLNVLAGRALPGVPAAAQRETLLDNLAWAGPRARDAGVRLVVEAVNDVDSPGYLYPRTADVAAALPEVGVQLDTYHAAVMGEDPATAVRALGPRLGHVQLGDHPGRHEPGTGAIDFVALFAALTGIGYRGGVGLECHPTRPVPATLALLEQR